MRKGVLSLVVALAAVGCGGGDDESPKGPVVVTPAPAGQPWKTLGEWQLFEKPREQAPAARVVGYEVIAPLYSDETLKHRFLHVPEGAVVGYEPTAAWRFPVGTILVKTFAYPIDARDPALGERLLETRLLVKEADGFKAHTYVWNEAQTEANLKPTGTTLDVSWIDATGATRTNAYGVPNTNQCQDCHGKAELQDSLGGRTRQLDRDGQIENLHGLGWLDAEPGADRVKLVEPYGAAPLAERARSYLDANCGACHSTAGGASQNGLFLDWESTDPAADPTSWGTCKVPTSAGGATCGLTYDIVPGQPDQSILICRVESREPKVQMPPLTSKIADQQGVALLREWVQSLSPAGCQ